jgi:putative intracellular protease/amidase
MPPERILIITGDFVEDYELMAPYQALLMIGHQVPAAAGVLTGKEFAGYKSIGPDLQLFGANYVEVEPTEVVVNGNVGLVLQACIQTCLHILLFICFCYLLYTFIMIGFSNKQIEICLERRRR